MNDRTLPTWLRLALLVMAAAQTLFGLTLLVDPGAIAGLWPWPLTAATARLLGASTLVSTPLATLSALANSWSVARIPIVMMLAYRVLQVAAGLVHYQRFDFGRPVTWNYFGGGGLMLLALAIALARGPMLGQPASGAAPRLWPRSVRWDAGLQLGRGGRAVLVGLAAAYIVLGLLFFVLGEGAGALWFEPAGSLTGLTARLFASPTLGLALAMWLISRAGAWREAVVPAIGMVTFGIAGLLVIGVEWASVAPPSVLGYLIPLTPLVLLLVGGYLLAPARRGR